MQILDAKLHLRVPWLVCLGSLLLALAFGFAQVTAQPEPASEAGSAAAALAEPEASASSEAPAGEIDRPRPGWLALAGVVAFVLLLSQRRVLQQGPPESL